jgi:ribosomal protein S18 acetylase RimI-like enzyme
VSLFVSTAVAARVERAEAEFMRACSRASGARYGVASFQVAIAGGVATYAGAESPYNKVAGVGFDALPTEDELSDLERRYAEHKAYASFEVSTLADPSMVELLTERGYQLVSFENVLIRNLLVPLPEVAAGIAVRRVEDFDGWLDVSVEAALHPDTEGIPQHDEFPREVLERAERSSVDAGAQLYLAEIDGAPAGAASVRFADGIAQLTGAGTRPSYRRRGVQRALTVARLLDAREEGCDLATVTVQPGSPSHASTQGSGFDLAYARAVLNAGGGC